MWLQNFFWAVLRLSPGAASVVRAATGGAAPDCSGAQPLPSALQVRACWKTAHSTQYRCY